MGDYPSGKVSEFKTIEEILRTVLDNPELRDELYTQICKQITKNPNKSSETKGFLLLNLVAGFCIPQEQSTLTFLHGIIMEGKSKKRGENIAHICETAEERLKETLENGSRRNPCTKFEYSALIVQYPCFYAPFLKAVFIFIFFWALLVWLCKHCQGISG